MYIMNIDMIRDLMLVIWHERAYYTLKTFKSMSHDTKMILLVLLVCFPEMYSHVRNKRVDTFIPHIRVRIA